MAGRGLACGTLTPRSMRFHEDSASPIACAQASCDKREGVASPNALTRTPKAMANFWSFFCSFIYHTLYLIRRKC